MMGVLYFLLLAGCFVVLVKGADFLVDASSTIAKILRIPSVVIGLTIVAFGTSVPEAGVSITSSVNGINALSISNVVGSNIFNLLIVVGLCSVIKGVSVDNDIRKRDYPLSIIASVLMVIFTFNLVISRIEGVILFILIIGYVVLLISSSLSSSKLSSQSEEISDRESSIHEDKKPGSILVQVLKNLLIIIASVVCVFLSSRGIVFSCSYFAKLLGVSDTIIGLTIVAIGTSLPELATSVVASRKGENAIALGNVVGSNIFNILFVLGISSTISPIENLSVGNRYDVIICLVITAICYLFVFFGKKFRRIDGIIMLVMYVIYMIFVFLREFDVIAI